MNLRRAGLAAAIAVLLAGLWFAFGPPRAVWLNTGLRIDYPWPRGASALAAALGAAGLAVLATPRALRLLATAGAGVAAVTGAALLFYRLEALDEGLVERHLLGTTRLAWSEIASVSPQSDALIVTGRSQEIRIDTGPLPPDLRASLERTIARRVREASERTRAEEPGPAPAEAK
jgi:hypothetical protein